MIPQLPSPELASKKNRAARNRSTSPIVSPEIHPQARVLAPTVLVPSKEGDDPPAPIGDMHSARSMQTSEMHSALDAASVGDGFHSIGTMSDAASMLR